MGCVDGVVVVSGVVDNDYVVDDGVAITVCIVVALVVLLMVISTSSVWSLMLSAGRCHI